MRTRNTHREEGLTALWKGNSVLIIRIFPYSAAQLAANDTYKRVKGRVVLGVVQGWYKRVQRRVNDMHKEGNTEEGTER
jgi:hypothetical protein